MSVTAPKGFVASGVHCGIRKRDRLDLAVVRSLEPATGAAMFTSNRLLAAPVVVSREHLELAEPQAVVVNSGVANAATGERGLLDARATAAEAGRLLGLDAEEVLVLSTGVIGAPLPLANVVAGVREAASTLSGAGGADAAAAIMTTDTFPKLATRQAKIGERTVTLNGFLKGSGMIAPDMATMLGFVFTDAKVPGAVLQKLLSDSADKSLNCVTVDGDTSTSDTLLVAATGTARHAPIEEPDDPVLVDFKRALDEVLIELAQLLARDGEGATKFVTINIGGASSNGAARKIGLAVANSPLVKTAIAGEDANLGRIVMAVGKSGERADRDKLRISIGGVKITDGGQVVPNYDEAPVAKHIKGTDIVIDIDLGIGRGRATVWTCDLTHGYIDINGSYRS